MSNRYAQNRYGGKQQQQQQKKFVAKSSTRTTNTPNSKTPQTEPKTLSNSLRQSDYASTRNLVSGGNFVNYLPQDEAVAAGLPPDNGGLDPVESQRVVDHLNTHLSRLLRLCPRDFWTQGSVCVSVLFTPFPFLILFFLFSFFFFLFSFFESYNCTLWACLIEMIKVWDCDCFDLLI
ncbi:hypothetical protein CsSME_00035812 [Camellia sinensis var. sinensis]